jgi:uncharacterized zinc-type alcohol dehydrogenase-like protein
MFTVNAYSAISATEPLRMTTVERRDVGSHDVLIDIKFCGVCHSDIHVVRGDFGDMNYPLTPGHEITGVVAAIGPAVTRHAVGDRVGVGCMIDSCRDCDSCRAGDEQYCLNGYLNTFGGVDSDGRTTQGGYSTRIVVSEDYVVKIPESLALDVAAPLLCAGISTYSPLRHWGVGPGKKVAVIGLGGLGHVAVKMAHAMGADVTVLSQSLAKRADSMRLGADRYYATSDAATFEHLRNTFDLILNTVAGTVDVNAYLSLVAPNGSMVNVGITGEPLPVNIWGLLLARRSVSGSFFGGIQETQEMLNFCAEHHLGADIEIIAAEQINEAYKRVEASDVRYRFVIDASTIFDPGVVG